MKRGIWIVLFAALTLPLVAQAGIEFRWVEDSTWLDADPSVPRNLYVEIRSTETGGEDVGAFEFKFTYNNDPVTGIQLHQEYDIITYYGIDTYSYVSAFTPPPPVPIQGQMSADFTGYSDDGDVNVARARSVDINPPDLGIHVDGPEGDWYRIARVTFDLGTEVEEPIEINFYYQKALPYDITEDPGDSWYSWSGDRKFVYGDVETGIDLVDFTAESLSDRIALRWETASERDNAGFYVWRRVVAAGERIEGARRMAPSVRTTGARRSMDRYEARAERLDAQWVPITENLIPAEGSASEGATYELDDVDVTQGTVYEYRLEDVDLYGESEFHGPVQVRFDARAEMRPIGVGADAVRPGSLRPQVVDAPVPTE